jgi:hypothetical protein
MSDSRCRFEWSQTSSVLAMLANVNRDPKKTKPFYPADFDPYTAKRQKSNAVVVTKENIEAMRNAFLGKG